MLAPSRMEAPLSRSTETPRIGSRPGPFAALGPYLLILLFALPAFAWGIADNPLRPWDEARLAVSSAEMALRGDGIIVHYAGQPDLWSVKPPLLIWLQAASMKLFGFSTFAARLPTLVSALATVGLIFAFADRRLRSPAAGFLACAVLLTSGGYVQPHVARTADYDAPVILWQTAQLVTFFAYCETKRARHWWLFVAALILAVMTKSVIGLAFLPALAVYAAARGQIGPLLREPRLYGGIALFLLVVGGYYAAHEAATPGYLRQVWESELAGRVLTPLNGQSGGWTTYLREMASGDFLPWLLLLPPAAWLALKDGDAVRRRATLLMLLAAATWLLVVSAARTKLAWYDAPAYPPLALVVGLGMAAAWARLSATAFGSRLPRGAGLLAAALLFAVPAALQARRIAAEGLQGGVYRSYTAYLDALAGTPLRNERFTLLVPKLPELARVPLNNPHDPDTRYTPVFAFYQIAYRRERAMRFDLATVDDLAKVPAGRAVALCGAELETALAASGSGDPFDRRGQCLAARKRPERSLPSPL